MKILNILKNIVARIKAIPTAKDYIVEQGTSGIWTYRKWASGIAECWGTQTKNISSFAVWSSPIYYASPNEQSDNYPSNLFNAIPLCIVTNESATSNSGWIIMEKEGTKTTTPKFTYCRAGSGVGNSTYKIKYYAKGLWKALEQV